MELDILGRKVVVEKVPEYQISANAKAFHREGRIVLEEGMAPDMEAYMLLHEVLHFVAFQLTEVEEEPSETTIQTLAAGLFAVLRQNKLDFAALAETGIRT